MWSVAAVFIAVRIWRSISAASSSARTAARAARGTFTSSGAISTSATAPGGRLPA